MSKLFTLNVKDFVKGLFMAIYGAISGALISAAEGWYQALQTHTAFTFDWNVVWIVSLGAVLAYLKKQLTTNSKGEILKKE